MIPNRSRALSSTSFRQPEQRFFPGEHALFTWGTVENLASSVEPACDGTVGARIKQTRGELYRGEVFIPLGGAKRHADRMESCGGLTTRLERG